ncbi:MFS transporter, partial [Pseudomonas fragi]|nr:MFS transporter [Pseudomonas sp. GC01]
MANPYREIFSAPGTKAFSGAGLLARMPISMVGIGIITMLAQLRDSYWLAGAVAATFALSMALLAPQISRWVDQYGQGRVLPGISAIGVGALLALLLCSHFAAPDWTLFVFAALAGCIPSMSAMVRARWTELFRGSPKLHTAFS